MVVKINTFKHDIDLCPVNSLRQPCEQIVFELYLIKYIEYMGQIQIQAFSNSQIQIR